MQLNPGKSYVSWGAERAPCLRRKRAPTSSSCSVVMPGTTAFCISRTARPTSFPTARIAFRSLLDSIVMTSQNHHPFAHHHRPSAHAHGGDRAVLLVGLE